MTAPTAFPRTQASHLESQSSKLSAPKIWTSRILQCVAAAFMLMDAGMKLAKPAFVVQSTAKLGYPESTIVGIGVALLLCTILYAIPRTAIFGAIFLTGYLGGAVASNVRAATPLFNVVFPLVFAALVWAPLVLRNKRLESILFRGE
jgi:DoxX-like family